MIKNENDMTQEEKDLVLKDLCARTPYNTKINVDDIGVFIPRLKYIDGITCHFYECAWTKFIDEIKPYLRPMSSMTEEEKRELTNTTQYDTCYKDDGIDCIYQHILGWEIQGRITIHNVGYSTIDWLNAHHFDYRGLIEKGLALEALEGLYKI